jgi:hypothetical protein
LNQWFGRRAAGKADRRLFGKCERFREVPILDLRRSQLVTLLGGAAAGALLSLVELGD